MTLQGLIMKGRRCQSLNSDFPVVSSLVSITFFFFFFSYKSLVTSVQQGGEKDEIMENKKKYLKIKRKAPGHGKPVREGV